MSEQDVRQIADNAEMIVRGYAFRRMDAGIEVVNLNRPEDVMLFSEEGIMLETNMDPIGQKIVLDIWSKDKQFMETDNAEVFSA